MELSEGEWDEIAADGEDASAEKMGAGTPAETVAAGAASEASDEMGAGMPAASSHATDASAASADAAEPAEGALPCATDASAASASASAPAEAAPSATDASASASASGASASAATGATSTAAIASARIAAAEPAEGVPPSGAHAQSLANALWCAQDRQSQRLLTPRQQLQPPVSLGRPCIFDTRRFHDHIHTHRSAHPRTRAYAALNSRRWRGATARRRGSASRLGLPPCTWPRGRRHHIPRGMPAAYRLRRWAPRAAAGERASVPLAELRPVHRYAFAFRDLRGRRLGVNRRLRLPGL